MARPTVPYTTTAIPKEIAGDKNLWTAHVQHSATLYKADIAARLAAKMGVDASKVAYLIDRVNALVREKLAGAGRISLGQIYSGLAVRGGFESADARFDPKRNRVLAYLVTVDPLRGALAGVTAQNTTGGLSCAIFSVMDNVTKEESAVEGGDEILVQGKYIGINAENADEGVWLEKADGTVAARATVVSSDSQTVNCRFPADVEPGVYSLVVSARNGNRSSLAPAEARIRNVTVK